MDGSGWRNWTGGKKGVREEMKGDMCDGTMEGGGIARRSLSLNAI